MGLRGRQRAALVGVLAAVAFGLTAGIAMAHYTQISTGNSRAWVDSTHDHLNVSDGDCDGNRVYAEGYDQNGFHRIFDPNGCTAGYGHEDGINFYQYRLCVEFVACSLWLST